MICNVGYMAAEREAMDRLLRQRLDERARRLGHESDSALQEHLRAVEARRAFRVIQGGRS